MRHINRGQMDSLQAKMAKAKGDSGFVVFVAYKAVPIATPMRGRPQGTHEEAEVAARDMLATPHFTHAWIVSKDGVQEVTKEA